MLFFMCAALPALAETTAPAAGQLATAPQPESAAPIFTWGGYFQALGFMCLLLALLWFGVWAARRSGKFNFLPKPGALARDALLMEAQLPLGHKRGLVVVRFLNKHLLLGVTDQQITLIKEMERDDDPADPDSSTEHVYHTHRPGSTGSAGQLFERLLRGAHAAENGRGEAHAPQDDASSGCGTASGSGQPTSPKSR